MKKNLLTITLLLVVCLIMSFSVCASSDEPENNSTQDLEIVPAVSATTFYSDKYLAVIDIAKNYPWPHPVVYYAAFRTHSVESYGDVINFICWSGPTKSTSSRVSVLTFDLSGNAKTWVNGSGYYNVNVGTNGFRSQGTDGLSFTLYKSGGGMNFLGYYLSNVSNMDVAFPANFNHTLLSESPDPSQLHALLVTAKEKQNIGYTATSWNKLQSEINAAEYLIYETVYSQSEINAARDSLQAAINGLILLPDTTELNQLIQTAKDIERGQYNLFSWDNLQQAILNSESLIATKDYTTAQISGSLSNLQSAINNLTLLPDTSQLASFLALCKSMENDYTTVTWASFKLAIAQAESLLSSGNYTETDILNALNNLKEARDNLVMRDGGVIKPSAVSKFYDYILAFVVIIIPVSVVLLILVCYPSIIINVIKKFTV